MQNIALLTVTLLCLHFQLFATNPLDEQPPIVAKKTAEPIRLDGNLDEAAWYTGTPAADFWEYFPTDTLRSAIKTEVFLLTMMTFCTSRRSAIRL